MAALKIKHVLGVDGNLLEEVNLSSAMTKGNKQWHVYLTNPKVASAIHDIIAERQKREGTLFNLEAPLFKSQKGTSFSPNSLQQLFHRMYQANYKVHPVTAVGAHSPPHSLKKGVDIKGVSTLMSHASIAMTARYVENNPARLRQICADLF